MSTVTVLEEIQAFLKENVCNSIKLKKPDDDNVDKFELINPNVFIMEFPSKNFLPKNVESIVPCIMVNFEDGNDDGDTADVNIRLMLIIYNPGLHAANSDGDIVVTPDGNGWIDLLNFIDKAKNEILKKQFLNGVAIKYPLKWGTYQKEEQAPESRPYFYGWITFSVKQQSYSKSEIDKLLE